MGIAPKFLRIFNRLIGRFFSLFTTRCRVGQKQKDDYIIKYIGAIDDNSDDPAAATKHYVSDAVNSLIAGKEVEVKTTKAIGCTIKWRKTQ